MKKLSTDNQNNSDSRKEMLTIILPIVIVGLSIFSNWLFNFVNWWAVLVNGAIVLVGLLIVTIINNRTKVRKMNKEIDAIDDTIKELQEAAKQNDILDKMSKTVEKLQSSTSLLRYVVGEEELMQIEASVGSVKLDSRPKIYVQSSKFQLETQDSKFSIMLQENLRNGVQYRYLIPSYVSDEEYDLFKNMVVEWWKGYSIFIYNKDACSKLSNISNEWHPDYKRIFEFAQTYWKENRGEEDWKKLCYELFELFKSCLITYIADESIFYIVTVVYQTGRNAWKAIIKLPTDYVDEDKNDYYSFVVFGEEEKPSDNVFIRNFKSNFNEKKKYDMTSIYEMIDRHIKEIINEKS